jgi:hypothetical protein
MLNFAPEKPQGFGPFTAPAPLRSGLLGNGDASAADRQIASADASVASLPASALGGPTTSDPVLGNGGTKLDGGNRIDGWPEGRVPVPSLARGFELAASPTRNAPGGILGMLIDAGYIDPANPGRPPAGGLPGLIQDYMRTNPFESGYR